MRNRIFSVSMIVLLVITTSCAQSEKGEEAEEIERGEEGAKLTLPDLEDELEIAERGKRKTQMREEILAAYATEGLTEEEVMGGKLKDGGTFYFSDDGESVIIQIKREISNEEQAEKIKRVIERMKEKFSADKVVVQEVDRSYADLNELIKQVNADRKRLGIDGGLSILIDQEKVELITQSISDEHAEELRDKYGEALLINIDPQYNPMPF